MINVRIKRGESNEESNPGTVGGQTYKEIGELIPEESGLCQGEGTREDGVLDEIPCLEKYVSQLRGGGCQRYI